MGYIDMVKDIAAKMNEEIYNSAVSDYEAGERYDKLVDMWVTLIDLLMKNHSIEVFTISDPVLECKFLHHINIDDETIDLTGGGYSGN